MPFDPFAMFRTPTPPAGPAPAPTPNPNPNANTPPIPGVDPNNPTMPAGGGTAPPQDPFKDFQGMWDIDPTKLTPDTPVFANIDQAKVMESARKAQFLPQMTPEQKTLIEAGGPQAFQVMQQILQSAAANVYGNSALATSKMIDQALEVQRKRFEEMLPGMLTKHQVSSALQEDNPIFSNPQLAPMVEGVKTAILAKFPNATPSELKQQVATYFNTVGAQFAPKPAVSAASKQADTDWEKFWQV
jgi:hypothetical protein